MFNIQEIEVSKIIITDRARKDLGDLTDLKHSITDQGLLNPILISESLELFAGERRLTAFKELELSHIPCRIMKGVASNDRAIIELIENTGRKSFIWHEELDLKYKIHKSLLEANEEWSLRKSAEKLGFAQGGFASDMALAEALESFPMLKELPTKTKARDAYKKLQDRAAAIQSLSNLSPEEQENLAKLGLKTDGVKTEKTKETSPAIPKTIHDDQDLEELYNSCEATKECQETFEDLPAYTYEVCDNKEIIAKLPPETVGFIELDPPYAIDFNTTYGQLGNIKQTEIDWNAETLISWYEDMLPVLYSKLLDNSWMLVWTGKEYWTEINALAAETGFGVQQPGIWAKPSGSSNSPKTNMISNYEMFLLFRKGQATFNIPSMPSVITFASPPHSQRTHMWEKPLDMYDYLFTALGKPGSIFLSPFAGSGNSMLIAAQHKMTPVGSDLKKEHCIQFTRKFNDYFRKGAA